MNQGWMTRLCRAVAAGMVACLAGLALPAWGAEPPPLADFFRRPKLQDVVLSPSGRHMAAIVPIAASSRAGLAVIDLQDYGKSVVVANFNDADVASVQWVNDDRLVFEIRDSQSDAYFQPGPGLFAVDREGKQSPRRLIQSRYAFVTEASQIVSRVLPANHELESVLRDGSNDVVVRQYTWDGRGDLLAISLHRLDTVTGIARLITAGVPAGVRRYALDAQGEPRALVAVKEGKSGLYWKPSKGAEWTFVREFNTYGGNTPPALLAVDGSDRLYIVGRVEAGKDTTALATIDLKKADPKGEPLVGLDGYDFTGEPVFGPGGMLKGVHFLTDGRATHWFDPKIRKIQESVDRLLKATANTIDCGRCDNPGKVLVTAESDRQPAVYYIYDVENDGLELVGPSRPWIDAKAMSPKEFLRYPARDGLPVPMTVTKPLGVKGPAPTIVLVHGGPYLRDGEWRWDETSQFLASRGYLVLAPEFRGSTGFGSRHFRAGWKQWGLGMHDDLVDAVQWAVKGGIADPKRVCLLGASYGGYAVMMGLIKDPQVFRCGVQWVGVTDIELMYSIARSDLPEIWRNWGMPVLVADREKDAEQIAATSPLRQAARLKQPLLMAYGGEDRRVPIEHGTKMRDALKGHNDQVEWIVYPGEGHGWFLEANDIDFWTRVEKFLGRHL